MWLDYVFFPFFLLSFAFPIFLHCAGTSFIVRKDNKNKKNKENVPMQDE